MWFIKAICYTTVYWQVNTVCRMRASVYASWLQWPMWRHRLDNKPNFFSDRNILFIIQIFRMFGLTRMQLSCYSRTDCTWIHLPSYYIKSVLMVQWPFSLHINTIHLVTPSNFMQYCVTNCMIIFAGILKLKSKFYFPDLEIDSDFSWK